MPVPNGLKDAALSVIVPMRTSRLIAGFNLSFTPHLFVDLHMEELRENLEVNALPVTVPSPADPVMKGRQILILRASLGLIATPGQGLNMHC